MHYYVLGVLGVSWVLWVWETYLDYRQYQVYKTTQKVPEILKDQIDDETFKKSKLYSIDKAKFGFISSLYSQIQFTLTLCLYLMPYFWDLSHKIMTEIFGSHGKNHIEWEVFQSLVFLFTTSVASTFINLPLSIYNTFVIEERHGFNKQTARFYAWDKTKKFFVSYIISAPVVAAAIYIVRYGGDYFFLYLWLFCFVVVLLLTFFIGEIMAIFDKFTPLPPSSLRNRIEKLAQELNFPLANIFVVEGSKRSSHSNAYQSGLFNKKRIVIYDTLIENYYEKKSQSEKRSESTKDADSTDVEDEEANKENRPGEQDKAKKPKGCNDDEIMAVLCHELGHWWCGHLFKNLALAEIHYFFMFLLFSRFYTDPTLYAAFGFFNEKPVIIGLALLMMILTPYNEVLGFIFTLLSRRFEYQSDSFAKKRGRASDLKRALVKLNVDNLGFPVHDELYSTFNHSHPTLIQRIRALDKTD